LILLPKEAGSYFLIILILISPGTIFAKIILILKSTHINQMQKQSIQHSGVGMKEKQKNTTGLSSLLVLIRVKPETTFIFTQGVSLSFRQSLSRNPVFSIGSGCPIKDFGHDMNKNSNLYTDSN
jgi:hypothetical protein